MHLRDFTRQSLAAFVKGNQRLNLGILVFFLLASTLPLCEGTGMFEVHFLDYANPGQRDSQRRCCSGQEVQGSCSSPCSTFFTVCLRPTNGLLRCLFGKKSSDVLGNGTFVIPSNSSLQIPTATWTGSFILVVTAKHKGVSSSVLIEEYVGNKEFLLPGTRWHNASYVGTVANFTFSYRMVCPNNYYGTSCGTLCVPRDDINGHHTCSSNGTRVCLPGWTDPTCTTAICSKGCDPNHGTCYQPDTCNCADGWKGKNCTECKIHPACLHGTCNGPWTCNCVFGWGGQYCDLDLEYCDRHKPCKNGAMCTNVHAGQYACACKKGYTGKNCETEINECSSDPCFNGGACTDLIGDFNCSCPAGFSGKQCYPDCVPGVCKNGGTCMNGIRGYSCTCKEGFSGSECEEVLPTIPASHPTSHPASSRESNSSNHPESTRDSTTNGTIDATTIALTTANQTIEQTYNSESGTGITKRTTMIVAIVVSILLVLVLIVACVAWKFWRKRRRESDHATPGAVESAQVNQKQIDIEDPDSKHCAGARSGNPEIIRNFVASKQHEKNTNKTQENLADEKILKGKTHKENAKMSLELSDITTTTTTTRRMNLDELYLPNRCFDQGFWQEVELEI